MNDSIRQVLRVQILIIFCFFIFKLIRPTVLESQAPEWVKLFLLSFPNFCEGVMGVLILSGVGAYFQRFLHLSHFIIYLLATLLAAIYVLSQEFKWHHLGGVNVYDPNDVLFSIVGLIVGCFIVFKIQPRVE